MMNGVQSVQTDDNSLLKAVYLGRLRLTRLLLEGGSYINESNEHGETPLMIACKSRYSDTQGVPKEKMVGYLLESGADPNIQDKSGKTALMHACLEQAGHEVVSLLLDSGADPCLEDHIGSSALIHAINSNDEETLKLLIDAFKAKGKEVIIITTDRLVFGRQMAKQYLKVPSLPELDQWNTLTCSPIPCASPSEIHLSTSPLETLSSSFSDNMFSFQDLQTMANSQTTPPSHQPPLVNRRLNKVHHLQRLHSEPWLKVPQSKGNSQKEALHDITPEEELAFSIDRRLDFDHPCSCQVNTDLIEASSLSQSQHQENNTSNHGNLRPEGTLSHNMSFNGLSPLYSLSHPDLHSKSNEFLTSENDPNLAVSSLINIIQRRKLGIDHYSSDSQLSVSGNSPADGKKQLNRQLLTSRSSTLISSEESTESTLLGSIHKRHPTNLERRGSGALFTDLALNHRPGFLPPLNHHALIPQIIGASSSSAICSKPTCGLVTGIRQYLPTAPAGLPKDLKSRRMLMRRHSMQPEQIKQLGSFKEIFG
ncbi:ankyrin repeat domain-containing protein 34B [Ictalurus punctatus]|uniref:Ankyrin repeat domain-containing protein 34B n=1 Tax=Ictalurus punctatus TaxID=7998 RepID=A0A2D0SPP3_ICTPU|nr:ankyrin repeat domain-containing protein 34B [Ictalurus punctatus]